MTLPKSLKHCGHRFFWLNHCCKHWIWYTCPQTSLKTEDSSWWGSGSKSPVQIEHSCAAAPKPASASTSCLRKRRPQELMRKLASESSSCGRTTEPGVGASHSKNMGNHALAA